MKIDYNALKSLTRAELDGLVPKGFEFATEPWDHQLVSFLATISTDGLHEWLDLGTGKTKVAIDVVRYFEWLRKTRWRVLVICLETARYKWADEVIMHSSCGADVLEGKVAARWDHLLQSGEPGFYITNYECFRLMVTERKERKPTASEMQKNAKLEAKAIDRGEEFKPKVRLREVVDHKKIRALIRMGWDAIVIDEAHRIKNPGSITFQALSHACKKIEQRMLLTGTPFGSSLLDLWSQYFIVDRGETLGVSYTAWREGNFEDKGWFGPDWKVTQQGKRRIERVMFNRAIRYEESEIKGMPAKIYRTLNYDLSPEQNRQYDDAVDRIGEFTELVNRTMVFRQICGGIVVKQKYVFPENPKLKLFLDLVDSVINEYKMVVFHEFVMEYELIAAALKRMKIGYAALNGKVSKTKRFAGIKAFQEDPAIRVMIAHPQSGGASLDFNCAHYCVFYSNSHDPLARRQAEKRIHRGKIKRRRFYYDLVGRNTIEVGLQRALAKNESMFRGVMNRGDLRARLRGGGNKKIRRVK